ncbi:MAG: division/cell wall cluster transcriptional repressor MraZ [Clostridia bacterium]|nr:division/cell wall cluster transcriptional repressor MraZ [Clostridia bacterium]
MAAYWGESFHTLDGANRLIVPARFREGLGSEIILYKAVEGCLFLYDVPHFSEITAQLDALSATQEGREKMRLFYADVISVSVDRTGRIVLPADFAAHAGLKTDVALLGLRDRIELWDKDAYLAANGDKDSLPAASFPEIRF